MELTATAAGRRRMGAADGAPQAHLTVAGATAVVSIGGCCSIGATAAAAGGCLVCPRSLLQQRPVERVQQQLSEPGGDHCGLQTDTFTCTILQGIRAGIKAGIGHRKHRRKWCVGQAQQHRQAADSHDAAQQLGSAGSAAALTATTTELACALSSLPSVSSRVCRKAATASGSPVSISRKATSSKLGELEVTYRQRGVHIVSRRRQAETSRGADWIAWQVCMYLACSTYAQGARRYWQHQFPG